MGVDQTGHHHLALEVDHPGVLAGDGFHVVVRTDFQEFAIAERERLGAAAWAVRRVNKTVLVHDIGLTGLRLPCLCRFSCRLSVDSDKQENT